MSELIIDYDLSVQPAIDRDMRIRDTAPEMLELMKQVADLQNPRFNDAAYMDLVIEMDRLANLAQELLAKIEGGGE